MTSPFRRNGAAAACGNGRPGGASARHGCLAFCCRMVLAWILWERIR